MNKPWKIGLGVLAGAYAAAQAVRIVLISTATAPPQGEAAQAWAAGNVMGSVVGFLIGAVACIGLLVSAFRAPLPPGTAGEASAELCPRCRARLPVVRDAYCPGCGAELDADL